MTQNFCESVFFMLNECGPALNFYMYVYGHLAENMFVCSRKAKLAVFIRIVLLLTHGGVRLLSEKEQFFIALRGPVIIICCY
jgi:hypothetical protein